MVDGGYEANNISAEDAKWVEDLSLEGQFLKVINLANTLAMGDLLTLCCARVAGWFRGKTPREIQDFFGIDDAHVLSPEQITKYCDDHKWAERLLVHTDDAAGAGGAGATGAAERK